MAGWKGHLVGGVGCCAVYVAGVQALPGEIAEQTSGILSDWQFVAGLFVLAMLMALFPDIDTNSKGQDLFFGIAFAAMILLVATGRFEAASYLGLLCMTPIIGKHRGWTHNKLSIFLVPAPIIVIPYINSAQILTTALILYGAAVVGYFSHLLLDGRIVKWIRVKA